MDNYEKLPESGLKRLHECRFYTYAKKSLVSCENIRIRDRLLRFSDSSRDKEYGDIQFLQIGVSMAKLQPLLNHCKFFMKCVFCTKFL